MTAATANPLAGASAKPVLYLVDTNILLRDVDASHSHHATTRQALRFLATTGAPLCLIPQNLIEFWVAATRPTAVNGLGLSPAQAQASIAQFEASFHLLPDTSVIFAEWKRIVTAYTVSGKTAHDARLIAAMKVHGLTHLLTFNGNDFHRYSIGESITVVDPHSVALSHVSPGQ
ncbi:MAG: PIN domain-containing protein [Abitibacteriaceae bacterium]|nr:PIN domain-containing protein [Abditibacteriaceae bacterium]